MLGHRVGDTPLPGCTRAGITWLEEWQAELRDAGRGRPLQRTRFGPVCDDQHDAVPSLVVEQCLEVTPTAGGKHHDARRALGVSHDARRQQANASQCRAASAYHQTE